MKIIDFLKKIDTKYISIIIIIILIIIIGSQCQHSNNLNKNIKKIEQNILAADSTIYQYKDENGKLTQEKSIWILSEKELKKQNKDLYNLVKNQQGDIISLNTTLLHLSQDTKILHDSIHYLHSVVLDAEQINKTEWNIPWILEYMWDEKNYDKFKGHTLIKVDTLKFGIKHINTLLDSRNSQIDLVFGEKVNDGKYNVFVTSKYPGLSAQSMQGVMIDPNTNKDIKKLIKKKHWFNGISIGIGISGGYDFINNQPSMLIGPSIGINIYTF